MYRIGFPLSIFSGRDAPHFEPDFDLAHRASDSVGHLIQEVRVDADKPAALRAAVDLKCLVILKLKLAQICNAHVDSLRNC